MLRTIAAVAAALLLVGCAGPSPDPSPTAPSVSRAAPAPSATASASPTPEPTPTEASVVTPPPAEPAPAPQPAPSAGAPGAGTPGGGAPGADAPGGSESDADIDAAASLQVVVNKRRPLQPQDYVPETVRVSIAHDADGEFVRPEADAGLRQLDAAMRAAIGEGVHVFSSYRSFARQTQLYNGYVAQYGQARADTTSARPGHSEHQTGLAVDVVGTGGACRLDACFGDTAAGRWIAEHAWQHGFVVRYPRGMDAVTGYAWEPWHLRYVGVEVSTAMHEAGSATLEEHFGTGAAPGY